MGYFFAWIGFSILVGVIGSSRKIGFAGAFFLSLILSPLIGLIFALSSKSEQEEKIDMIIDRQNNGASNGTGVSSYYDELFKLKKLHDDRLISLAEFESQKAILDRRYGR